MNRLFSITQLHARQILDSRGNPTVEVDASFPEEHAAGPPYPPVPPPAVVSMLNCAMEICSDLAAKAY
ncbi:Enolase [hydrothermal vent metagenome]|uniref:Enolase n=1 Tax=hydrothermal vent metagenome TaxID=652676 RepID=A0A3B0YDG8_9ZZZZ